MALHSRSGLVVSTVGVGAAARVAPWAAYVLAATLCFMVVTFPVEALIARLSTTMFERMDVHLSADHWTLGWPMGIAGTHVAVSGWPWAAVMMHDVEVHLRPFSLIKGPLTIDGTAHLRTTTRDVPSTASATLEVETWSARASAHLVGRLHGVDLSQLGATPIKRGTLTVELDHRWPSLADGQPLFTGEGTMEIRADGLQLEALTFGSSTLPPLVITTAHVEVHCKEGTCRVALAGEGPDGIIRGDGIVTLRMPVPESLLHISVSVTMTDSLRQRIPAAALFPPGAPLTVTINGSVAHPAITL